MRLNVIGRIPEKVVLACSGGPDSMAVLNYLLNNNRRRVMVAYFNHGTEHGDQAEIFIRNWVDAYNDDFPRNSIHLSVGRINDLSKRGPKQSLEEYWREERYKFFMNYHKDYTFITAHHLDDQVEQYLFSVMHGKERLIPYRSWGGRVIRPFLLSKKEALVEWCDDKGVSYMIDPSNEDTKYMRNYIRHEFISKAMRINPGIHKTVRKKMLAHLESGVGGWEKQ